MKNPIIIILLFASQLLCAQNPKLIIPIGHTNTVVKAVYSPDEKLIASCSWDGSVKIWDAATGSEMHTFYGHSGWVTDLEFSPDGKYLASTAENDLILWSLSELKEVRRWNQEEWTLQGVAWSPDGKRLVCGAPYDYKILIIDSGKGEISKILDDYKGEARDDINWSSDGKYIIYPSGTYNEETEVSTSFVVKYDVSAGSVVKSFQFSEDYAISKPVYCGFSKDGSKAYLAMTREGGMVIWDTEKGTIVNSFDFPEDETYNVVLFPDEKRVLVNQNRTYTGDTGQWIYEISLENGKVLKQFEGKDSDMVYSAVLNKKGDKVVKALGNKAVEITEWKTGKSLSRLEGKTSAVTDVAVSPDGTLLAVGGRNSTVFIWDMNSVSIVASLPISAGGTYLSFSKNGEYLAAASTSEGGLIQIWSTQAFNLEQEFETGAYAIQNIDFAADNKTLMVCEEGMVHYYSVESATKITSFETGYATGSGKLSPDGQFLYCFGSGVVEQRKVGKAETIKSLKPDFQGIIDNDIIESIAISPDGKTLAIGMVADLIILFDINSGKQLRILQGHKDFVSDLVFSNDNKYLYSVSGVGLDQKDNTVRIWEVATGKNLKTMTGHNNGVISVAVSSDGKRLFTGSEDHTVKIWDIEKGVEIATLLQVETSDWVVTTPSGLFDASPGAMKKLHYSIGLEIVELEQLKDRYYEPGLLQKLLGYSYSEPLRDVQKFGEVQMFPTGNIAMNEKADLCTVTLTPHNGGVGRVQLFINGKEVAADANKDKKTSFSFALKDFASLMVDDGENTVSIRTYNEEGWLKSPAYATNFVWQGAKYQARQRGNAIVDPKAEPILYGIVVGTSNYKGDALDLLYADVDAKNIATALQNSSKEVFQKIDIKLFNSDGVSKASTKANIAEAFKNVAANAKPEDVFFLFFSGHGETWGAENPQFYYLTGDMSSFELSDKAVRESATISTDELTAWLNGIAAQKQVMVFDACNSGKAAEKLLVSKGSESGRIKALDRMKDRSGVFVLCGSASDKSSFEDPRYGQGILTYSLLSGMSGEALREQKFIDVMSLFQFARDRVPQLAKSLDAEQTPVLVFPYGAASFDIGMVKDPGQIPLVLAKPVFSRSNFLDAEALDDSSLSLSSLFNNYLADKFNNPATARFIYSPDTKISDALSLTGLYTVSGDDITLNGKLKRAGKDLGKFVIQGKKSDMDGFLKTILNECSKLMPK